MREDKRPALAVVLPLTVFSMKEEVSDERLWERPGKGLQRDGEGSEQL